MVDFSILKLRLWLGVGLGIMSVYYRDVNEIWIVVPFLKLRVYKERKVS